MIVARRAHATGASARRYPQVEPGAESLIDGRVVPLPEAADAGAALRLARRRDASGLSVGDRIVLRSDLARAVELGLDALAATALARPVPVVDARASEVRVRRALADGAAAVLVRERGVVRGMVAATREIVGVPVIAPRLARQLPPATLDLLATATALAAREGARLWLVGGVVRDVLRERPSSGDLDVVVEGDGHQVARALADAVDGEIVLHDRFLTASVDVPGVGTVDVITARSERYDRPGSLPRVMPAGIRQDLERRDFTVNAMAVELTADTRPLLDPLGGRIDLAQSRLRILHPLSFVEDPTRLFRAARYGARLGFALDAWSARCERLALSLVPYEALSGARITAELGHMLVDVEPSKALAQLGAAGVFRLLDRRYRFTARTAAHVAGLGGALASARSGSDTVALEVTLLVLLGDQPPAVAAAALRRLGIAGETFLRIERALGAPADLAAAIASAPSASARARLLRGRGPAELIWLALSGPPAVRAAVDELGAATGIAPALRGDDVIALGVPRGPAVAQVLERLRDARLDGEVRDRDSEAEYVRQWVETREEG